MEKMITFVRRNAQITEVELLEVPIPKINSDELLVKVEAFGVEVHDCYFISLM